MNDRQTRDMFAAHALQGLLAVGEFNHNKADEVAHDAYKLAECMMAERERRLALPTDGTVVWTMNASNVKGE